MKTLLIGGTALVGPHLLRELRSAHCEVFTLTRTGKSYFGEKAFAGDRSDLKMLVDIFLDVKPDCVVDMIPFTREQAALLVRAFAMARIVCPIIAVSSIDVYAAYAKLHKTEDTDYQTCPISEEMCLRSSLGIEGLSYDKLGVEQEYRNAFQDLTVIRLPALYGWPDTSRAEGYLLPMLAGNGEVRIPRSRASWRFSRCFHKNAAYALALCVLAKANGLHIYNVAEKTAYSEVQWCQRIAEGCGWTGTIVVAEDSAQTPDFSQDFVVSSSKIRLERDFYEKYNVEEGLADTIAFFAYQRMARPYKKYY